MSKDLSKNGNKCISCGARARTITMNYDYRCPDCSLAKPKNNMEDLLVEVKEIFPEAYTYVDNNIIFWIEDIEYIISCSDVELSIGIRHEGEGMYSFPFPFCDTKEKAISLLRSIKECEE